MATVSLATNTYCMMEWWTAIAHAHLAPWAPGSNLAVRVNRAIDDRPGIQQKAICYQWFKQWLILSVPKPSINQQSQIKEDAIEPSVPARKFNLKAYAAVTWHNDRVSLGLEPRLTDHHSHVARTATLPTAPPRQVRDHVKHTNLWNFVRNQTCKVWLYGIDVSFFCLVRGLYYITLRNNLL